MKKTRKMSIVSLLLVVLMLLSVPLVSVVAQDKDTTGGLDLSKSKGTTNLDSNYESKITLSLPADDYKADLDVVFVLDGSTSTDEDDLASNAAELLNKLSEYQNLNIKAGLVVFGGSTPILYTSEKLLNIADEDNLDKLTKAIIDKSYDSAVGRSGSNLQAGIKSAQAMLDADTEVENSDKYMILLTDGGARMWVNDNFEAMSQGFTAYDNKYVWWGQNQDFTSRYIEQQDKKELRSFDEVWQAGNSYAEFAKYAMTKTESQEDDASDKAASWNTVCQDEDSIYYTSLEAATYYAATSIVESSEKCHVIWIDYPYHSGEYAQYTDSFKTWLADNNYITRYDSKDQKAEDIFSNVKDQLVYLVDAGTTVVDYMGYVEGEYNFDFVNQIDKFTLTVDGKAATVKQLSENSYGFGELLENNKYEYELTYYIANDGNEYFQWDINVPVRKDEPVRFTYTVKLVNAKTTSGTYGNYDQYGKNNDGSDKKDIYTNNKATLNPVDSNGKKGASQDFLKPSVSYTVKEAVPSTGDNSHLSSFVTLFVGSAIALTSVAIKKKEEK